MAREQITDLDDPRIAIYRSLKATNQTRGLSQFVVEGEKLVRRLLASRYPTISILATERHADQLEPTLPAEVPLFVVPFERIHDIVGFPFHRGVLASGSRVAPPDWREIVAGRDRVLFVVCPRLSNPENLGAVARIADVFGVDAILAGPRCPDPLSRRVLRVSMGSALQLPVLVSDRLEAVGDEIAQEGGVEFWAAAADVSAVPFEQLPRPRRLALVMGEEDQGVEPAWLARCRQTVTIPMRPGAGSLNVAVATGILLYHLTR